MPSSEKLTCKVTLRQVFICLRPRTPPLHTLYLCTIYFFTQGRDRERETERERDGEGEGEI